MRLIPLILSALLLASCGVPPEDAATPQSPVSPGISTAAPGESQDGEAVRLPSVPAEPPATAIVGTRDHRVVVVDTRTGQELRTLASYDDPDDFGDEGEPFAAGSFFDSLALSPDGRTVFISVCCEPAPGRLYRIQAEGGEATMLGHGYEPAVRGDGEVVAVTELQWITFLRPDGERVSYFEPRDDLVRVNTPAWSPDGKHIAFIQADDARDELMLLAADATSMAEAVPVPRPEGTTQPWVTPTFTRDGLLVVAEQGVDSEGYPTGPAVQLTVDPASGGILQRRPLPDAVRTQVHDASGGWLLATLADGTSMWWGPQGQEGSLGGGLVAAAW